MLYLLDRDVRTVRWNGLPLHEASSAIVKEELNGDHFLVAKYPISDSGIYRELREDLLIKAPVPVLGSQLFRIKKPVEHDDHVELTAYHITDDIMKRSVEPMGVNQAGCAMALSQLVQRVKTPLGDFSLTSDIFDRHTFNTKETETLYSVLMDGKHSIVGTWEGELVRDNFALSVKKARGSDRGVIITTHNNLESYQRTRNSQGVVTRVHAKSTFRPEGAEVDTVLQVTVDSPLINQYPYINEKEYENNEAKTVEELRKWAEAKFANGKIDQATDAIEIEAYELDGQTVHLGDTVTIKSRKHGVDLTKKAIAYEFDCLANGGKGAYLSLTFDDSPGLGGSGIGGVSEVAEAILEAAKTAEDRAIDKAIANANAAFDAEFDKAKQAIEDGIEEAKAAAEVVKAEIGAEVEAVAREGQAVKQAVDAGLAEADRKAKAFESDVRDRVALVETKADQIADQARQSDEKANQALTKAGASETLAQMANQVADRAKTDAAAALTRAEAVKREAIAEAQRLDTILRTDAENRLATARTELLGKTVQLQTELETAKQSIASQARDILAQAQAQSELTTRLQTVETTANGTKTTVTELSKTLNTATGNLASVTQRVASTETSLVGVRDQYSQLSQTVSGQTGQITAVTRQTADLQRGLNEVTERFEKLKIGGVNLLRNSDFSQGKEHWARLPDVKTEGDTRFVTLPTNLWTMSQSVDVVAGETYTISFYARKRSATGTNPRVSVKFDRHNTDTGQVEVTGTDWQRVVLTHQATQSLKETIFFLNRNNVEVDIRHVQVERGNVATDYAPSEEDIRQELATYVRTSTENTARLERNIQTTDGKAESARTLAQQTAQGLALKAEKSTVDGLAGRVQSAETSIQAIGGRITTEIAETKALIPTEVGGRNLVRGSAELKQGSRGWAEGHWRTSGSGGSVEYNVTLPSSPIKGVTKGVRISSTDSNQIGLCQDGQSLPPGTYTFSVWVLGSSGLSPHIVGAYSQESGNPFSAGNKYANLTDSNWTLVTQTFTLTKRYANISLAYLFLSMPGTVYYAAPYIHSSSLVGSWSPAPEDLTAELETVKTTITQTSEGQQQLSRRLSETQDKVTTAETKITQLIGDVGSKVSQVEFDRVKNRVDSQQTAITQNSSAIALKAEKTYVDGVKSTADSAKAIADGLKTTSATKAELKVVSDGITQLATKTEVDGVTGRLTTAEASIRTQAEQIAQRLTSTQVEKAITDKGYQTKAQVDANITGRGYITNAALAGYVPTTSFDNYKTETAQAIERGLTATRAMIPTNFGARNYAEDYDFSRGLWEYSQGDSSVKNWTVSNGIYTVTGTTTTWKQYQIFSESGGRLGGKQDSTALLKLEPGGAYTLSFQARCLTGNPEVWVSLRENRRVSSGGNPERIISRVNLTRDWQTYHVSTKALEISPEFDYWRIILGYTQIGTVQFRRVELTQSNQPMDAGPAPEDMVTSVDFNRVKETAQLYERVIGRSEGDIQTNVARQVLTSQLYQTEVTRARDNQSNLLVGTEKAWSATHTLPSNFSVHQLFYLEEQKSFAQLGFNIGDEATLAFDYQFSQNGSSTLSVRDFRVEGYTTGYKFLIGAVISARSGTFTGTFRFATADQLTANNFRVRIDNGNCVMTIKNCRLNRGAVSYPWQVHREGLEAVSTRVSQLVDSYGVKVLGNKETILSELNLNSNGVRIAGKLIHLDGTVTASAAFFQSVLADKIEAGNIKAGAVTTAKIAAGAVTADHLLVNQALIDKLVTNSVWAERLFAQSAFMAKLQATKILAGQIDAGLINTAMLATDSVTADKLVVNQALFTKLMANEAYLRQLFAKQAFITQVQAVELSASKITSGLIDASRISVINLNARSITSGILKASNGATSFNLDNGDLTFNSNATINFNSSSNAIERRRGGNTGFMKVQDSSGGGVNVMMGATSGYAWQTIDTGRFAGFLASRDNDYSDYASVYGDTIYFRHDQYGPKMWIHTIAMKQDYNLVNILDKLIHNMGQLHKAGAFGGQTHFTNFF